MEVDGGPYRPGAIYECAGRIDVTTLDSLRNQYLHIPPRPMPAPRSAPYTPRPMVCAGCGAPLNLLTCSYCLRDNRC